MLALSLSKFIAEEPLLQVILLIGVIGMFWSALGAWKASRDEKKHFDEAMRLKYKNRSPHEHE